MKKSLPGSSSGDELSAFLAEARPDPMLGAFDETKPTEDSKRSESRGSAAAHPPSRSDKGPRSASEPPDFGASTPAKTEAKASDKPDNVGGLSPGSYDSIQGLALGRFSGSGSHQSGPIFEPHSTLGLDIASTSSGSGDSNAARRTSAAPESVSAADDERLEETPRRGRAWPTVLLASYASAVTIGMIWVLWTGRRVKEAAESEADFPAAVESRPAEDPGLRADRSRRIMPPPPIPSVHQTMLGKPLRMGLIEVTPLDVASGPVNLQRGFGRREVKPGGKNALKLRLRIRNLSTDSLFAPLDEGFLRERPGSDPDSFIDCGPGAALIGMYPLAVESEWSVVGQAFLDLRPGEEFTTAIVSVGDALERSAPEMTWRVRLRTDINHTDVLGVHFRKDQVLPQR